MTKRLAAFISPAKAFDKAIERVQLAEKLGYESVFSTQTTTRDGLMTVAGYVNETSKIHLGTGVLPAFPRHPVSLAIEAATLDELSGGRLILGVGPSHQLTMENWYGIPMNKAFSRLKEYVHILREIFTTGGCQFKGEFYTSGFAFMGYKARPDIPIYISALSPNMLAFAGASCDGTVLWACLPSYIASSVAPIMRKAAADANRATPEIVAAIPSAVTTNREAAFDAFRKDFFVYMSLPFYRRVIAAAGYEAEIEAFDKANSSGDFAGALQAISDSMLTEFAAVGSANDVREKIEEYRAAGASLPAVGLFDAGDGYAGAAATLEAAIGA